MEGVVMSLLLIRSQRQNHVSKLIITQKVNNVFQRSIWFWFVQASCCKNYVPSNAIWSSDEATQRWALKQQFWIFSENSQENTSDIVLFK